MEARHLISILTLNRAINYMVSQSDNNACNWLIYFVGGMDFFEINVEKISNFH